jgi:membrane associated rhomboid family serine protease
MFPLRDDIPSRRASIVTWTIVGANVLVFVYQLTLPEQGIQQLFYLFGIVPARFLHPAWAERVGFPDASLLPFFTSMFLHGGFFHVLSNMWSLWIFGDNVEDRMGRFRFLLFYLLCGLAAGFTHALTNPNSAIPTVGASGAIAGVLGAYLRWYPHARVLTLIPIFFYPLFVHLPALVYLGLWFVSQLFSGTMSLAGPGAVGGVAWWAHIGGFVAGFLLCGFFSRRDPDPLPGPRRHVVYPVPPHSGAWRAPRPSGDDDLDRRLRL